MFTPASVFAALGLLMLLVEYVRPKRALYDYFFLFNASYVLYFSLAPIHVLVGGADFAFLRSVYDEHLADPDAWFIVQLAGIVATSYVFTLIGYYSRTAHRIGSAFQCGEIRPQVAYLVVAFSLIVGVVAIAIYARQFGGLQTAVLRSAFIRAGLETTDGAYLFVKHFIPLVETASLLIAASLLHPASRAKALQVLVFLGSLALVLLAAVISGGRRSLLIFFCALYFLMANYHQRRFVNAIAIAGVSFLGILIFGDQVLLGVGDDERGVMARLESMELGFGKLYSLIWSDFTLPFIEAAGVIARWDGFPRVFLDALLGMADLIPERIVNLQFSESLLELNTRLLKGLEMGETSGTPPGLLGFYWYSGYLPGVVVGSFAYGAIGRSLEVFFAPRTRNPFNLLVWVLVGFSWAYFMRMGLVDMLVNERIHWLIGILMLVVFAGFRRVRAVAPLGPVPTPAHGGGP